MDSVADSLCTPAAWDEGERLAALDRYAILDTGREAAFDDVAELAAIILDAPIAVVNFIAADRQWFKAEVGIGVDTLPLDLSICRHAILQPGVLVVPDLRADARFESNPLVAVAGGLRFYAGALLETPEGLPLGTVCVLDRKTRPQGITDQQRRALRSLTRQTMAQLELRRAVAQRDRALERQRFLSDLSDRLRDLADPVAVAMAAAAAAGRRIGVARAGYGEIDECQEVVTVHRDWTDGRSFSLAGEARLLDAFGPAVIAELRAGRSLVVEDFRSDPRAGAAYAATWESIDARSLVVVPLVRAGRLRAIFYLHEPEPRAWRVDEIELAEATAERTWAAVEQARTEAALRASEAEARGTASLLEAIGASAPNLIYAKDRACRLIYANPATLSVFGKPRDEVIGQTPAEIAGDGSEGEAHVANDRRVMETGRVEAMEEVYTTLDGVPRIFRSVKAPLRSADGEIIGVVGVSSDMTDQIVAEQKLRQSEATLRSVVDQMPVGVIIAGVPTGEILIYNRASERIMGHPILGATAEDYGSYGGLRADGAPYSPDEYPTARAVLRGETVRDEEMRYRRGDGEVAHLSVSATPIELPDGGGDLAVCTFVDISARKRAEDHQRLLINELNHRAKNLLAIIQGVAQQSFKGAGSLAAMKEAFEGRLGALAAAHNILTQQNWEAAPIRPLILNTLCPVAPPGRRIEVDGPDLMLPPKTGVSLAMAIHELGTNALKYGALRTGEGSVEVRWRVADKRLKLVWRERGGPAVSVPDTRGFGTRMIERGLAAELGGKVRIDFQPEGVVCTVDAPLPDPES